MFVILANHPDRPGVREYLQSDYESFTPNLQEAHTFVQKHDESTLPWPADETEAKAIEELLEFHDQNPVRVMVVLCDKCAAVIIATKRCPICESRELCITQES